MCDLMNDLGLRQSQPTSSPSPLCTFYSACYLIYGFCVNPFTVKE